MALAAVGPLLIPAVSAGVKGLIHLFHHKKTPEQSYEDMKNSSQSSVSVSPSALHMYNTLIPSTIAPFLSKTREALPRIVETLLRKPDVAGPNLISTILPKSIQPYQATIETLLRSVFPEMTPT